MKLDLISVDGQFSPETDLKVRTIIKGDQSNENIMAASILAKVYRDNYMKELEVDTPFIQIMGSNIIKVILQRCILRH